MVPAGFVDLSACLRCGVYLLLRGGAVVYVGQSKLMLARIAAHRSLYSSGRKGKAVPSWLPIRGIYFDQVFVQPCPSDRVDALERELIDRYRPRFNVHHKPKANIPIGPFTLNINGIQIPVGALPKPEDQPFRRRSL